MPTHRDDRDRRSGLHVAIIMDGNGRWAEARGLARTDGHIAGALAVERVVRAAPGSGIGTLSLFAFSAWNWSRPKAEVDAVLEAVRTYLLHHTDECRDRGVRVRVIGRRDRMPAAVLEAIESAERATSAGNRLALDLALDYSSRESIVAAARRFNVLAARSGEPRGFAELLSGDGRGNATSSDVDLLIRTGGEKRLSDFLLWECAWAEIVFSNRMWPEFDAQCLQEAVRDFRARERRFGQISAPKIHLLPPSA